MAGIVRLVMQMLHVISGKQVQFKKIQQLKNVVLLSRVGGLRDDFEGLN